MISAGDFKNGVTFELDGQIFQVMSSSTSNRVRELLL